MSTLKKVAVIQSSYIPWKGYFDIINDVDIFLFHEDLQYTKLDWRNRNKIKTAGGSKWITVPISDSKNYMKYNIDQVKVLPDNKWQKKHLNSLKSNYAKSKYFNEYKTLLEDIYLRHEWESLSEMNIYMTKKICEILGIDTQFFNSVDFEFHGKKTDKLINICKHFEADHYLSGPAARDYIEEEKFQDAGITLEYKDYSGYPEYSQLYPPFDHYVTVLDLIFNYGPQSPFYIWGWRQ